MRDPFDGLAFRPADILLPQNCDYTKWSVVACDQYTSQPEYWQEVEELVGSAPSDMLGLWLSSTAGAFSVSVGSSSLSVPNHPAGYSLYRS